MTLIAFHIQQAWQIQAFHTQQAFHIQQGWRQPKPVVCGYLLALLI